MKTISTAVTGCGTRIDDIHVRFLDEEIRDGTGSPWSECSVPLHTLAARPIASARVLIVENKVNLLTLPPLKGTIGLGGMGDGVTDLRYVVWLGNWKSGTGETSMRKAFGFCLDCVYCFHTSGVC